MLATICQLHEISKQILSAATQDHWQEVDALQRQREQLTTQADHLPIPVKPTDAEQVKQIILEIQAIDAQVQPLLETHRQALIDEKLQQNKGQRMARAYQTP